MNSAEFRIEPPESTVSDRLNEVDRGFEPGIDEIGTAAASILLGLRLRGNLCESDRALLRFMAPPPARLFLVWGDDRLDTVEQETWQHCIASHQSHFHSGAIFTDHINTAGESDRPRRHIHTALVEHLDGRDLVLGLSELPAEDRVYDIHSVFANLLARFRQALPETTEMVAGLKAPLNASRPCLIVNRGSGRIIAVNDYVSSMPGLNPDRLIDREFSRIPTELHAAILSRGLKMVNLTLGNFSLAAVYLLPERTPRASSTEHYVETDLIVDSMRRELSSITSAMTQIENLLGPAYSGRIRRVTESVRSRTAQLDLNLEQLRFDPAPTTNAAKDITNEPNNRR